jgi:hypothetical protein
VTCNDRADNPRGAYPPDTKVRDILKGKKGSIARASLEPGSPGWEEILDTSWSEIETVAREGKPGYRTIRNFSLTADSTSEATIWGPSTS